MLIYIYIYINIRFADLNIYCTGDKGYVTHAEWHLFPSPTGSAIIRRTARTKYKPSTSLRSIGFR
jgi:hypothetical protein